MSGGWVCEICGWVTAIGEPDVCDRYDCPGNPKSIASAVTAVPETGLEDVPNSELIYRLEVQAKREKDAGWYESAKTLIEAARRLREKD